jgi:hypothetical protein
VQLENGCLKIPAECEQMYRELRGYQLPDTHIVQDSIMALAIGIEYAGKAQSLIGRIMSVLHV